MPVRSEPGPARPVGRSRRRGPGGRSGPSRSARRCGPWGARRSGRGWSRCRCGAGARCPEPGHEQAQRGRRPTPARRPGAGPGAWRRPSVARHPGDGRPRRSRPRCSTWTGTVGLVDVVPVMVIRSGGEGPGREGDRPGRRPCGTTGPRWTVTGSLPSKVRVTLVIERSGSPVWRLDEADRALGRGLVERRPATTGPWGTSKESSTQAVCGLPSRASPGRSSGR